MNDTTHRDRDRKVLDFLIRLFHEYFCASESVTLGQCGKISPHYFFKWLDGFFTLADHSVICAETETDYETYELVQEIISGGNGAAQLMALWWPVCLARRPRTSHAVALISWGTVIHFEDGTITPLMLHTVQPGPEPLHDGELISSIQTNAGKVLQGVEEHGLDGLHAMGANLGGEPVFNIMIGAFLKIIPQMKPEYREQLRGYVRLVMQLLYPPLEPRSDSPEAPTIEEEPGFG